MVALVLSGCGRNAPEEAVEPSDSTEAPPAGPTVTTPPETQPTQVTYIIQAGDSLSGIAARFNVDVRDLADFNAIADVNSIKVGQQLSIPPVTTPATNPTTESTTSPTTTTSAG